MAGLERKTSSKTTTANKNIQANGTRVQHSDNKNLHRGLASQVMNPFITTIQHEVDKALHGFYDLFEPKLINTRTLEQGTLSPSMDLLEDKDSFKIEVEMPGLDEKDVTVTCRDNLLTICGEKTSSKKNDKKNYVAREISYGRFERSIALPQSADSERATATFKKGMLWVVVPKRESAARAGRQIKITKAS